MGEQQKRGSGGEALLSYMGLAIFQQHFLSTLIAKYRHTFHEKPMHSQFTPIFKKLNEPMLS